MLKYAFWNLLHFLKVPVSSSCLCTMHEECRSCYTVIKNRQVQGEDPVHQENGKWYFWDETWSSRCGPYSTRTRANKALDEYAKEVLGL